MAEMAPYQKRVVDEKAELDIKRGKLDAYLRANFMTMDPDDRDLLVAQQELMLRYSHVLLMRINRFTIQKPADA